MKKFLGTLFILLVAGGAAAPYVSGYYAKKYYYHALDVLSKSQSFKIDVESYDMGWMQAKARLKITLPKGMHHNLCPGGKEPMILKFEENIQHGPLLLGQGDAAMQLAFAKIDGKFVGFDEAIVKNCGNLVEFKWPIPPADLYSSVTIVNFNGDLHTKFKGKLFEYKKNEVKFTWQGLHGEMNLDKNMMVMNYKIYFPGLQVNDANQLFQVKEMALSGSHQKMLEQDLWLGDVKLNIANIAIQEGQVDIALNGMTFGHVIRLANNLLVASGNYIVDSMSFDKIKLGPINMMFSFHHLDPAFVAMLKSVEEMATQSPDGYLNALKKYQSKNKEDALTIINNQLKKTPEAKIDQIIVQNTKGQVLVNAMASLGGPEAKLDNLENYFMLLMMAKSSGELMIDETVFDYLLEEQSRETASALPKEFWVQQQTTEEKWVSDNVTKLKEEAVKTGVFIKEGKKMISRFKYENSNFTINGKTIKDIVAMHAELNKPKPEPVPTPVAPAAAVAPSTTAPSVGTAPLPAQAAPVTPPQSQAIANNPNDPAKPSEPMPISEVKELPKVEGATPIPPPQPSPASEGGSVMVQPGESHR